MVINRQGRRNGLVMGKRCKRDQSFDVCADRRTALLAMALVFVLRAELLTPVKTTVPERDACDEVVELAFTIPAGALVAAVPLAAAPDVET